MMPRNPTLLTFSRIFFLGGGIIERHCCFFAGQFNYRDDPPRGDFINTARHANPYNWATSHSCWALSDMQMKGRWESIINVSFRFIYYQKLNWAASLFPKQNHTVLSPNFHMHVSVSDFYIPGISLPRTDSGNIWIAHRYTNRKWEQGRTVSFLGIYVSNFL
jgi:hypothetical protein